MTNPVSTEETVLELMEPYEWYFADDLEELGVRNVEAAVASLVSNGYVENLAGQENTPRYRLTTAGIVRKEAREKS